MSRVTAVSGVFVFALLVTGARADTPRAPAFTAVALGTAGGLDAANLTSFLIAPAGRDDYVALDAGTLIPAIGRALDKGGLRAPAQTAGLTAEGAILVNHIKAYLISHPHLDHFAGLALASPDDGSKKPIFGSPRTLDALRAHFFNGVLWANFTDEGAGALGKYHLVRLAPGVAVAIPDAALTVELAPLSHAGGSSSAFLLRAGDAYALYLGDTGPDDAEHANNLDALFNRIAPLVKAHALRAMFIECSYPDPRADGLLFGHLTPSRLIAAIDRLARLTDEHHADRALGAWTIIVTHIKPSVQAGQSPRERIAAQLEPLSQRGLRVVIPEQGQRIDF